MIDMQKARSVDIDTLAATDWGELRSVYSAALDEIDRLRDCLIEERAQWNAICRDVGADPRDRYCTTEDDYPEARQQLEAEGKI